MARFCLTKDSIEKFLGGIKSGKLDPAKLAELSSEERRTAMEEFVGAENAKQVNTMFESKLLLKNQQQGMITWIKKVAGLSPETKRDLVSKVEKLDAVLDKSSEQAFLSDLVEQRLGTKLTLSQYAKLTELSKAVQDAKAKGGLDYGNALAVFSEYFSDLKNPKLTPKEYGQMLRYHPLKFLMEMAGATKSIVSSLDNSALGRQGWGVMLSNPKLWARNAIQSFRDIAKQLGNQNVKLATKAEIFARPRYEQYVKEKLDVGVVEEAFPEPLPSRIPLFGRLYKASDAAFSSFLWRTRADLFDQMATRIEKAGGDITGLGQYVNSMTGRGPLGKLGEPAAQLLNRIFFSPRLTMSRLDILTRPLRRGENPLIRKQAAIDLTKIVGSMAAVLALTKAFNPNMVEEDPRSADFGKVKIGNTRIDISGGAASLLVLATRLATRSSKSSTTGQVTALNSGKFGSQTGWDVLLNAAENKLSPVGAVIKDLASGQTFSGEKPTVTTELMNAFVPLSVQNSAETLADKNSAPLLLAIIADGLGFSTNTYGSNTIWANSQSQEMIQFREKVGDQAFQEANDKYNKILDDWYRSVNNSSKFKSLSDEEKKALISRSKEKAKQAVFKQYGYKPKVKRETVKTPKDLELK